MKYTILFIILAFFSCKTEPEKTTTPDSPEVNVETENTTTETVRTDGPLKTVDDIKSEYGYLNQQLREGKLDSLSFNYNCNGERGGKVTYYREDGKLKVIEHSYNEYSHYSTTQQYFLKDNQAFFAFYKELAWQFDGLMPNGEPGTKDDITEKRFYLLDNVAIECLEKKYIIRSSATDNPNPEDIPNQKVNCKDMGALKNSVTLLLKYQDQTSDIGCLK